MPTPPPLDGGGAAAADDAHVELGADPGLAAPKKKVLLQPGSTFPKMSVEGEGAAAETHGHRAVDAKRFKMRIGPRYKKEKKKAPSGPAMFELVYTDCYTSQKSVVHLSDITDLPEAPIKSTHKDVPSLFCSNVIVPHADAKMFGGESDGVSTMVYCIFAMTQWMADALKDLATAPNAVKLFVKWCQTAPSNEGRKKEEIKSIQGRMKIMALVGNWDECALPSVLKMYNAKPVLINKSGDVHVDRKRDYIEQSVNIHLFGILARKGLSQCKSKLTKLQFALGATIESRDETEMPEIAIFSCEFFKLPLFDCPNKLTTEAVEWLRTEAKQQFGAEAPGNVPI